MSIIIQSGWTKGRGRYAQPQRHHGASQFHKSTRVARTAPRIAGYRVRVRLQAGDIQRVRSLTGHPARNWENNLPAFQSAMLHPLHGVIADVSSLVGVFAGSLLRLTRGSRHFLNFTRPLKASGSLSSLVKCFQQPTSGLSNRFESFSRVVSHAVKEQHGANRWNEKAFPNTTKVLMRVA